MSQKTNLLKLIKKLKTCTFTMTIATQSLLNFLNQMCSKFKLQINNISISHLFPSAAHNLR